MGGKTAAHPYWLSKRECPPPGIKNFNVHEDRTTIAQRWTKWVKQFELYVIASGVTDADQKRALFLHMAGPDIQDIYDTLSASGDTYELAL